MFAIFRNFLEKKTNSVRTRLVFAMKIGFVSFDLTFRWRRDQKKAEEAFACISQFWDEDLEYFEKATTAESQLVTAENHFHENNELFLIDEEK